MKSHPIMGHNRISQYHMTHDHTTHYQLAPCPAARRREALLHLAAVYDPALQPALQQALTAVKALPDTVWQGLWLATHGDHIEAAAWVQPLANQTAQLWLPRQLNTAAYSLLESLQGWVREQPIALCHVSLPTYLTAWEKPLTASGMRVLATLAHLVWPCQAIQPPQASFTLLPLQALTQAEQFALLARVGAGSLDCPALRETLPVETLLAGFHAQAACDISSTPSHWFRLDYQGESVGVLLLATHQPRWSLQLMGLVPEWRGKGIGRAIIQHAQALAAQAGALSLSLTVDGQNTPAQRVYAQAGLVEEGREVLLAWC